MHRRRSERLGLLLALGLLGGCVERPPATDAPPKESAEASQTPTGMPRVQAPSVTAIRGRIEQVERAGPYTYVRLDPAAGGSWVVVMGTLPSAVGDDAAFVIHGTRTDFYSKRLDRQFDELLFGQLDAPT